MNFRRTLAGLFAIYVGLPFALRAQPNAPIEQFERTQRELQFQQTWRLAQTNNLEVPEFFPGENADVGPQRILRLIPRRTLFEVVADSQALYTDNAYLSDANKVGGALFINTLQAAFAPEPKKLGRGIFSPMLGFRSQWFNYDGAPLLDALDFNAQTAFINARYQISTWQFYAGFDFTRLLDQGHYNEAYREYVPTLAVQKFFPIRENLLVIVGGQFSYHATEAPPLMPFVASETNDRYDFAPSISLNYEIIPNLILQPFYRFQYTHYRSFSDNTQPAKSRVDFIHTVGGSLIYSFTKKFAARAFVSYENQDSNFSGVFDYHKFDAGGGLSFVLRF